MKRNRKIIFTALVIILMVLLAAFSVWVWGQAEPKKPGNIPLGDYTKTVEYADKKIQHLMKEHDLPSAAVVLIDDQEVVWQGAFGFANIENETPAREDTVYKLWSVAKVFTAIEIMRLVEDGLVELDAPITEYLPGFSIQSRFPDAEPITIRSILAHHSGLPRNECHSIPYPPDHPEVLSALAASLKDCYVAYPVGYRYKYVNIGPDLLGFLIEEMRGESYPGYMRENLLDPIGMENSAFLQTDIPVGQDAAMGYEYYKGVYYPYEQADISSLPSGNLYSTLDDMAEFVKFILRGGEVDGEQIINPETLKQMYVDQYSSPRDPQPMGLGWKTARLSGSELLVWHDGGPGEGIGALVALLPESKLGLALFANEVSLDGSISLPLAMDILELMLETKSGIAPSEEEVYEPVDVDRSILEGYTGRYIAFGQVMDVSLKGEQLKANIEGLNLDLLPVGQNRFKVGHWLLKLGLADFLPLPVDLEALEIQFMTEDDTHEDMMIISMDGAFYEICPRYPSIIDVPSQWEELAGTYELVMRLPSGEPGREPFGRDEIQIDDGVLLIPGIVGPIKPISETEIIIQSGPFSGETIYRDPDSVYLYHQWVVFNPNELE